MKELVEKMQRVERRISQERGPFVLFALFLLPESLNMWDVVVSAPWADERDWEASEYVLREMQKELTLKDFFNISRVMVIPSDFEDLEELHEEHPVEHGKVIVRNREFGMQIIQKGYIITCRPPVAKAA